MGRIKRLRGLVTEVYGSIYVGRHSYCTPRAARRGLTISSVRKLTGQDNKSQCMTISRYIYVYMNPTYCSSPKYGSLLNGHEIQMLLPKGATATAQLLA